MSTLILWDIDGTLLLTGGAGKHAFNATFLKLYNEPDIWQNINPDGRTDFSLIRECYTKRLHREPTQNELWHIKDVYEAELKKYLNTAKSFRLMPHVETTLDKLSKKTDTHLGLATGNFKIASEHKLKRAGLHHFFKFGGFGCDAEDRLALTQKALENGKILLGKNPKHVILVGDTIHDVACGQKIGAKTIAVCTGSTPRQALEKSGADIVADHLGDVASSFGIEL